MTRCGAWEHVSDFEGVSVSQPDHLERLPRGFFAIAPIGRYLALGSGAESLTRDKSGLHYLRWQTSISAVKISQSGQLQKLPESAFPGFRETVGRGPLLAVLERNRILGGDKQAGPSREVYHGRESGKWGLQRGKVCATSERMSRRQTCSLVCDASATAQCSVTGLRRCDS